MCDNYQIRFARENELDILNRIEEAASTLFENTKYANELCQTTLSIEFLRKQQENDLVWVVVDEQDSPLGFAVVIIIDNYFHLHELSVDPGCGRKGLGTRLTKQVIEQAKESKYKGVTLSTFREIPWNAPFYEKLGFREMKEEEIEIDLENIRIKELEMGLPISERVIMVLEL